LKELLVLLKKRSALLLKKQFYKEIDNAAIHVIGYVITLTNDIVCYYMETGKMSPVSILNY
jgi:protein involved in sex pheromone biosynthesis